MPAFQFDSNGVDPQYGGMSSHLPLGKHPVVIIASELKPTKDGQGGYMALQLQAIDGPAKGVEHTDRLNLHNKNADTVRIANGQLSAYCHVIGVFRFQSTEELHGKPFVVEIIADANGTNPNATKVAKLYDMNGNEPGKAGAGAQQQAGGAGFGAASGGQAQGGGFQAGAGQVQGGAAAGGAGGGWGAQGGGQQQQQQQQQGQGGAGPGWGAGAAAGGAGGGASPAGGAGGGWSQGAGAAGGAGPGWGAR